MQISKRERIVLSVGGSLIVPNDIDTQFLKDLNTFIRNSLKENPNRQFFLIAGGGYTARKYIDAAQEVIGHSITDEDKDWQGIHATRLNAQLLRNIFQDIAHLYVLQHWEEIIRKVHESVIVVGGATPGHSTDFAAVTMCEDYQVSKMVNMTNIDQVHSADPKKDPDAKPIEKISWTDFRKIVGDTWSPGLSAPFDPIAAKKAEELGLSVVILNGKNFENLKKYLNGEPFIGTTIEPQNP